MYLYDEKIETIIFKIMEIKKNKLFSVSESNITEGGLTPWDLVEKSTKAKNVLIKNRGKVVAKAVWEGDKLVVSKIRRPDKTALKIGQILNQPWQPRQAPPSPELKTSGHVLVRNKVYSSEKSKRKDPFWEDYAGWFIIPEKINNEDGVSKFLNDYPELKDSGQKAKLETIKLSEFENKQLKMARYNDVDEYVCGISDQIPQLYDFVPPKSEDMVVYAAEYCQCGCGDFERWHLYWLNRWVVYIPRGNKADSRK
jgi:hypothetical protein